ncbi:MAG: peptidoglycan-binding protein [Clostridia bacterium]|nr:peptidoglycan-binding protein [Clostridia bacterium]
MAEHATRETAIRNLQRYLRRISYEEKTILPPPIDGIFDSRTAEALSEFQRIKGLPVTGRSDRTTHEALFEEYSRLLRIRDERNAPELFPSSPANYVTVPGEHHSFIVILQWLLNELKVVYDALPLLPLTGVMDEATSGAVKIFQEINGFSPTGQVDRESWNRLVLDFNQYGGGQ